MKVETKIKRRVISDETCQGFEDKLNSLCENLGTHTVIYNMNMPYHCAYVEWEESEQVPENIRDEYHIKGIRFYCGQCPYFEKSQDGRVKHHQCSRVGRTVRYEETACLNAYQLYADGIIKMEGGK